MALHNEIQFETDICNYLGAQGWLHASPDSDGNARTPVSAAVPGQLVVRALE